MFPDGTPDMQTLLHQAAMMQQQLMDAQEKLTEARIDGTAGNNAVKATVSGTGDLVALVIDPSVCDPEETEMLADLVLAAVHDATANAQRLAAEQMSGLTGGFGDEPPVQGQLGF
jgi:DNA-binding YbaB/EbfC family protein